MRSIRSGARSSGAVVKEVADHEPREERLPEGASHRQGKKGVEDERERNAHRKRHDKAILVVGKVVVHAVEEKVNGFPHDESLVQWKT